MVPPPTTQPTHALSTAIHHTALPIDNLTHKPLTARDVVHAAAANINIVIGDSICVLRGVMPGYLDKAEARLEFVSFSWLLAIKERAYEVASMSSH